MSRMFELMRQAQLDESLLEKPVVPTSASGSTNSHNFELLRQAQKDELLFNTPESKAVVSAELAPSTVPGSSACGETFKLVHRLFLAEAALAPRVVVFCAVDLRNEDSCTCAQAAELLASQPQNSSVCVVDAKVARPSCTITSMSTTVEGCHGPFSTTVRLWVSPGRLMEAASG